MPDKYGVGQDSYCYPGTETLKNLLNIKDDEALSEAEAAFSLARYEAYRSQGMTLQDFNLSHLQALHHHLFQDVYEWAGSLRTVDISKGNTRFCNCQQIEKSANRLLSQIPELAHFKEKASLSKAFADLFCELNVIHPFREGNGRAQRFFFEELAFTLGFEIIWPDLSKEAWITANIHGYHCNLLPLEEIFNQALAK